MNATTTDKPRTDFSCSCGRSHAGKCRRGGHHLNSRAVGATTKQVLNATMTDAHIQGVATKGEHERLMDMTSWAEDANATMAYVLEWLELQHGTEQGRYPSVMNEYHRCMARLRRQVENSPV